MYSQVRVVIADRQVFRGIMFPIYAVTHVGNFRECLESVQEAWWDVQGHESFVVQNNAQIVTESRRLRTRVDNHVAYGAVRAAHQFSLAMATPAVHSADSALP